ncbi:MAG: hypothetical protein COA78_14350 [Blastopirellula sp.]|nr:MAG: hypothetical protein COA78_14350 [Blastopirellula sp.]
MGRIIRTKSKAEGGITTAEKARMDKHADLWISRALRTEPIEPGKIVPAIEGIYAAANLKNPRVIIVPSPLVMAFAYGASAAILHTGKKSKTYAATRAATYAATGAATRAATDAATDAATYAATRAATGASIACYDMAGELGLACARRWWDNMQGGNMWAGYDGYLTACRDILGLELSCHNAYAHWEQAAIHGGFRVMHEDFCIVSDFPEFIHMDAENRPHCEDGPSHRWRDGWSLYHWHGVKVPGEWIENRETIDPAEILKTENVEERAAGAAIIGWPRMLDVLKSKTIDKDENPDHGELIELTLPGLDRPGRFLKAECPRNGIIVEGVPYESDIDGSPINTVLAAQAWRVGETPKSFEFPPVRT